MTRTWLTFFFVGLVSRQAEAVSTLIFVMTNELVVMAQPKCDSDQKGQKVVNIPVEN